jgi:acyl carrier protein
MSVRARVLSIVSERLTDGAPFQFGDADSFLQSGIADSLRLLSLLEALESEFQIAVEPNEFTPENLDSIGGITQYLASKGVSD